MASTTRGNSSGGNMRGPRGRGSLENLGRGRGGDIRSRGGGGQATGRGVGAGGGDRNQSLGNSNSGNHDGGGGESSSQETQSSGVFRAGNFPAPNPDVTRVENDYMLQAAAIESGMSGISLVNNFPTRPAYGTRGKPVVLWANYFVLNTSPRIMLHRYHVNVSPEAKGRKLKRVFELLLQEAPWALSATDYKALLISLSRVEDMEVNIAYRAELEDEPQPDSRIYCVRIQHTGQLDVSELLEHIGSTTPNPNFSTEKQLQIVQALNVLLGHYPQSISTMTTISSNKHFTFGGRKVTCDLGAGLVALRGYFRSVRPGTSRILVNINVSHAVFYKPGPLVDLINVFAQSYGFNPFELEKFLRKVRVEMTHLPVKTNKAGEKIARIKTIFALATTNDGFSSTNPPRVLRFAAGPKDIQFWRDSTSHTANSGSKTEDSTKPYPNYITVYDYFETVHNLTIKLPQIPVMNCGTREKPVYIPAEYCNVLPGQSAMKKLNPDQTTAMIGFACRPPNLNATSITRDGLEILGLLPQSNPVMASFGLTVNTNMITVPGRILGAPMIRYGGSKTEAPKFGSWNMRGVKFTAGARVPSWTCLWIKRAGKSGKVEREKLLDTIIALFSKMMKQCGLDVPPHINPGPTIVLDGKKPCMTNDELILKIMGQISAKNIGLVFVLLPDTESAIYDKVKYAGDILYGINTVCAVDSKVSKDKGRDQYLANIALKVNSKLFGTNQSMSSSNLGIIGEGKTMVVGIDVTHPSPGSLSSAPSIAAIVASIDRTLSQFPCELSIQESRKEMVTDLAAMLKARLNIWLAKNKTLPENILIYRDGVSEGQYQVLQDIEIPSLRKACDMAYPAASRKKGLPKITMIVVGKRHHTRFYPTRESEADRSGNSANGTVVDRGVTNMWNWDFFLQAHSCLQGTAKPAHYYVVLDEIFGKGPLKKPHPFPNTADTLEDLTHNMCYLYARATKAVSICPPAYYADLACERARCYLSSVFDPPTHVDPSLTGGAQASVSASEVRIHDKLKNSMFYI